MLIKIKLKSGGEKIGKVDVKALDEVPGIFKNGFLMLNHSSGLVLIHVTNIASITRAT